MVGSAQAQVFKDAGQYFDAAWSNANGRQVTVDYSKYADESKQNTGSIVLWNGRVYRLLDLKTL